MRKMTNQLPCLRKVSAFSSDGHRPPVAKRLSPFNSLPRKKQTRGSSSSFKQEGKDAFHLDDDSPTVQSASHGHSAITEHPLTRVHNRARALGVLIQMASNISKWQTRQGELKADIAHNQASASIPAHTAGVNAIAVVVRQPVASTSVHSFFPRGIERTFPEPLLTRISISNRSAGFFT